MNFEFQNVKRVFLPYVFALIFMLYLQPVRAQRNGFVTIEGGGFVTSVIASPHEEGLIYAKTDVGGISRWLPETQTWKPLFGWVAYEQTSYFGVEALAIDPSSPNNIYALVGTSYWNGGKSAILRSSDYGETYEIVDVTSQFKVNGNGSDRQKGESLAVDPNSGNVLFCGTRYNNGLFKSVDSGETWNKVNSFPVNDASISFVIFDPQSPTNDNATQRIFVGAFREGDNLYVSNDGGETWEPVDGNSGGKPQRCVISSDGFLYVSYATPVGAVKKMNIKDGVWSDITPSSVTNRSYSGIDVDLNDPSKVIATTYSFWQNEQQWGWGDAIFYSEDGGATWSEKAHKTRSSFNKNGVPWVDGAIHWAGCATFDPFKPGWVFVVSGNGIYACENISENRAEWKFMAKGIQEIVALDFISLPGGPLITSVGDQGGFVHTNIHEPPLKRISQSSGFAYAGLKPSTVVRIATDLYISDDYGTQWKKLNGPADMTKGKVAISSDAKTILWRSTVNNKELCYYTNDLGTTWNQTQGLDFSCIPTADPVNPSVFYAYNRNDGYLYISKDGGANFIFYGFVGRGGYNRIAVAYGHEGKIWVPMYSNGLSYSDDKGSTFRKLNVVNCSAVSVGLDSPNSNIPSVFIYGKPESTDPFGMYMSLDLGETWTRLDDDKHQYGFLANAGAILADMNDYGKVYRSTAGIGIPFFDAFPDIISTDVKRVTENSAKVFPNPFINELTIQTAGETIHKIEIYNLNGQMVESKSGRFSDNQNITIGGSLIPGIYLLKINYNNNFHINKIIKK